MKLEQCSQRVQKLWARTPDKATPRQRRTIEALLRVRPDMAPLRFTGSSFVTPLRTGSLGCYAIDWVWIRREIRRGRQRQARERAQQTAAFVGGGI